MAYVYNKVNWEDLPSTNTPRNATNLGNMDTGIKENNNMLNGTKPMGSIVVDDVKCKNMLNYDLFLLGNISNTGEYQYNTINFVSDYIEVQPNTKYIASANAPQKFFQITEFDSSKTFIQKKSISDVSLNPITTTSNTKYIRVSYNKDNITTMSKQYLEEVEAQLELGEVRTSYTPYKDFENEEVYSTNEIVIGRWIDGKPLYRKTYQTTNIASTNTNIVDITNLNIDTPVRLYGMIISSTGNKFIIPSYDSSATYNIILANLTSIRGRAVLGDGGSIVNAYITIEYTKTTSGTRMLNVVNEEEEDR